jgi:hypothetical protein
LKQTTNILKYKKVEIGFKKFLEDDKDLMKLSNKQEQMLETIINTKMDKDDSIYSFYSMMTIIDEENLKSDPDEYTEILK